MRQGELNPRKGCMRFIGVFLVSPILLTALIFPFGILWFALDEFRQGRIGNGLVFTLMLAGICYGVYKFVKHKQKKQKGKEIKASPDTVQFQTTTGKIQFNNPFRGFFIVGAAGSGKSESIAVPLMGEFISKNFAGIVYDFKFPTLANDVQTFIDANRSVLRHYFLNFNDPYHSYRLNPIKPLYLPNTSYAREYSYAIVSNLMKESIKKPDFWSRSATDLLTACIWYLREERPDICDLPHVCAMITSNDTALLAKLQENPTTAQMTISIYNAMQRGAEGQTAGVIGTLQGAIAQINTPELMYIFGADEFSLDVNNPEAPIVVTVGSYPTLTTTLAPLCSLVLTVAIKLMNQPGKSKSFVLLDEAPTCYIPNLEVLPNTGRSNKIASVIMCQDLSQLTDGYGKEKSDVLFSACNNHFYGRVASSHTSEILSKQFGKTDKTYVTNSRNRKRTEITSGQSETVQERDIMRPAEFLSLQIGEFAGIGVETNLPTFKAQFLPVNRPSFNGLKTNSHSSDIYGYYKQVRQDINKLLGLSAVVQPGAGNGAILNNTQTNSKPNEQGNVFDIFGD